MTTLVRLSNQRGSSISMTSLRSKPAGQSPGDTRGCPDARNLRGKRLLGIETSVPHSEDDRPFRDRKTGGNRQRFQFQSNTKTCGPIADLANAPQFNSPKKTRAWQQIRRGSPHAPSAAEIDEVSLSTYYGNCERLRTYPCWTCLGVAPTPSILTNSCTFSEAVSA